MNPLDRSSTLAPDQTLRDLPCVLRRTASIHIVFWSLMYHKRIVRLQVCIYNRARASALTVTLTAFVLPANQKRGASRRPLSWTVEDGLLILYSPMSSSVLSRRSGLSSRILNSFRYYCSLTTMASHNGMAPDVKHAAPCIPRRISPFMKLKNMNNADRHFASRYSPEIPSCGSIRPFWDRKIHPS